MEEWDIKIYSGSSFSVLVPRFGRKTTININENIREDRAADGTLKQDILFVKREFIFDYSIIKESDLLLLDSIYSFYRSNRNPLNISINTSGFESFYLAVPRPISRTRLILSADNLYENISFVMLEA